MEMLSGKMAKVLKALGEKTATTTVSKASPPSGVYQPKVPQSLKK